jgi:ASC-1-like (ASCH) protein
MGGFGTIFLIAFIIFALLVAFFLAKRYMNRGKGLMMFFGGAKKFRLSLREPWFKAALNGEKTVELRLKKGVFSPESRRPLKVGDEIVVARSRPPGDNTEYPGPRKFTAKISSIGNYETFSEAIVKEKVNNVFGKENIKTADSGAKIMKEFYTGLTEEDERKTGIVSIKLSDPKPISPKMGGYNSDDEVDVDEYYY